jgi:hypothetical protein
VFDDRPRVDLSNDSPVAAVRAVKIGHFVPVERLGRITAREWFAKSGTTKELCHESDRHEETGPSLAVRDPPAAVQINR